MKLKGTGQAASSSMEQLLVLGESPASAFQAPLHWDRKHVRRVTNAPKEALLMKKIRGRVANIVWAVYPTRRWLHSSVRGREELVCKNTSDTL